MKKMIIIAVIFLALVLSSCDVLNTYNITVRNSCADPTPFPIRVKLTLSSIAPSMLFDSDLLSNGATVSYSDQNYGKHYLHIMDPNASSLSGARYYSCKELSITKNDTWIITWDNTTSAYVVNVSY